jgi:glycosyltransferase involved in cell wall biosynthesis
MNNRLPLSVAVITLNEEENLSRCLESVRGLASEIVVIDSGSTDRTREIAQRCSQPWVLCLDADEAVSPELGRSVRQLFRNSEMTERGFLVNRLNFYLGHWIRHAWYPEWRLRLVYRERARWTGPKVHERLEVEGATRKLAGDLLHYPFRDLQDHLLHWINYARNMAEARVQQGRAFRWYHLVLFPWFEFFKRLIVKQGWRDGWHGWLIAFANLIYVFAKHAFVLEKKLKGENQKPDAY